MLKVDPESCRIRGVGGWERGWDRALRLGNERVFPDSVHVGVEICVPEIGCLFCCQSRQGSCQHETSPGVHECHESAVTTAE